MKKFSVAILSDMVEEQWPSMDLVSDMLYRRILHLHSTKCDVSQVRPPMRRRFSKLPLLRKSRFANNADRLLNRFIDYPSSTRALARSFDIFHVVDHSYSQLLHYLPPRRTVVTCHDLETFRCLIDPSTRNRSLQFRLMAQRILDGFAKASHVLCVSETVRRDLLAHQLVTADRVTVVSNGVDQSFSIRSDVFADLEAASLIGLLDVPYLLSVGSSVPRKRLDILLRVFAAVRKTNAVLLVRVGGPFTAHQESLIDQLQIRKHIKVLPFVETRVLAAIYRMATLTLVTSEAEGFGLPLVEAMACGCPIVASDIPVLREIAGPAAVFCPVADITAWGQAVVRLLLERAESPTVWQQRKSVGVSWASRFTWEKSAAQCVEIYQKVLERQ